MTMKKLNYRNISLRRCGRTILFLFFLSAFAANVFAQEGRLVNEKIHGVSLEKNVTGEQIDRSVAIYLPPSYDRAPFKRYPVIYLLHGIGDTEKEFTVAWKNQTETWGTIQGLMNQGIAERRFGEMIIVMPDQRTNAFGSFYVNSSATGNWEDFTCKDLVNYIDGKYRTIAKPESRGIAGHSMGGYGAITLGMKHPEIFSVVYAMNPAILGWAKDFNLENPAFKLPLKAKSLDELMNGGLYAIGTVTVAQAFSPNPNRPPFYADFPFTEADGKLQPAQPAFSRWEENFPVNMVKKYRANLLKLRGLRFDSGYEDEFLFIPPNSRALSAELTGNGIEHIFEEYNGDHRNRLHGRTGRLYNEVLPYFWLLLESR
jgi:enterochelin esterase-like enzyme